MDGGPTVRCRPNQSEAVLQPARARELVRRLAPPTILCKGATS